MFGPFLFCNHLAGEERAGCFTLVVFLKYCDCYCCVALPHGAVCWSAVCDCGISWSYFLQMPHLNAHADIPSGNRNLHFGLSLHLHPNSVYTSTDAKVSSQSMQVCMLV